MAVQLFLQTILPEPPEGIFLGFQAAKEFADGEVRWRKRLLVAIGCLLPGGTFFGIAVF